MAGENEPILIGYDSLIVAGGSYYGYVGHDEWRLVAREVKSLESALAVFLPPATGGAKGQEKADGLFRARRLSGQVSRWHGLARARGYTMRLVWDAAAPSASPLTS